MKNTERIEKHAQNPFLCGQSLSLDPADAFSSYAPMEQLLIMTVEN